MKHKNDDPRYQDKRLYNINNITRETFYQLPKVFFTKHSKYVNLSLQAAVAFSFLKDRLTYSIKNNWVDEKGNIFFIYTNEELGETLKIKSRTTVVKVKKELEKFGLLIQKRMGINMPNRLYLLQPEVTAQDVYEINNENTQNTTQSLQPQGSSKNGLPENTTQSLQPQGSSKNGLPENTTQSLQPQGSSKNGHNQEEELLDTKLLIQNDTQLDFSKEKYTKDQISIQDQDLMSHITDIFSVKAGNQIFNNESLRLMKSWCGTPKEINRMIRIILNAKNKVLHELMDNNYKYRSYLLDLEDTELQDFVNKCLRNYFNRIRQTDNPKKKIKNYEAYLYTTMLMQFRSYLHEHLQAIGDEENSKQPSEDKSDFH